MSDHLDRYEYMVPNTALEEAVRSAIIQMNKMADDHLRDYLTGRGFILATPEHDRKVIEKFLRERDTPSVRIENPEFIAPLLAKVWDEGHTAGVRNASAEFDGPVQDNPYKREGENR